ncbi:MAG: acyl carrier protein [Clostridia bacterium]
MVFTEVQSLLSEQLNIAKEKITMQSDIITDLGADSLDVVELLMTLEDKYSISVPDEVANTLKTVGALVEYVESVKK